MYASTLNAAFAPQPTDETSKPANDPQNGHIQSNSSVSGKDVSAKTSTSVGSNEGQSNIGQSSGGQGQKAYEITKPETPSGSSEDMPLAALLGVILVIGLVCAGYFKTDLVNLFRK